MALSSCEAEIVAASEASKDAVYFKEFLRELGEDDGKPVELGVDNKAARDLAYNPEHHERTKHIARRHFYVRELVEENTITVPYVNTNDNLADFFTKPLGKRQFRAFRDAIMNIPSGSHDAGAALYTARGVLHGGAPPDGCIHVSWS